ncbi:MAG TPA: hypothetical protein VK155_07370 [Bacteroidales bacterium]|nr:hypothetical protein [Bacteroidales bacterium]
MRFFKSFLILSAIAFLIACGSKTTNNNPAAGNDTITVPDTGYTGIKQFMSGKYIVSEVNFVNGVRQGLTKTFYQSGRLQRTYWYEKGVRQDSSCWYYEEGQLFRTTPFRNDTVDGIQKQFYRTGELKAEMGYKDGFRTEYFKEYTREGKPVNDYPDIVVRTEDNYKAAGRYSIILELSDKKVNVNWRRGEFTDGKYDTAQLQKIIKTGNTGRLDLKKTGAATQTYVNVIAEILTDFANRKLVEKKIVLPYNDLK